MYNMTGPSAEKRGAGMPVGWSGTNGERQTFKRRGAASMRWIAHALIDSYRAFVLVIHNFKR